MTFFTVTISDTVDVPFPPKFEPGACDEATALAIAETIYAQYEKFPVHSAEANELWKRYEYIDMAAMEMSTAMAGYETWWDEIPGQQELLNLSRP